MERFFTAALCAIAVVAMNTPALALSGRFEQEFEEGLGNKLSGRFEQDVKVGLVIT